MLAALSVFVGGCGRDAEPEPTPTTAPLSIVDAISTVGPPIRRYFEAAQQRGEIGPAELGVLSSVGSTGRHHVLGSIVEVDDSSITILTFISRTANGYLPHGENHIFLLKETTQFWRGGPNKPVAAKDLHTGEIVEVSSIGGVYADVVLATGLQRP